MSLSSLLEQIKNDEIVLPDIQRDFVWEEYRISKLFDSIMRSYPLGIILLWETYENIQYRNFLENYHKNLKYTFFENNKNKKIKIVLDGQQRLQSLYVSIYGKYNNKELFFDVLSGMDKENFEEEKYIFKFYSDSEISKLNDHINHDIKGENDKKYFVKVKDLLNMSAKERLNFKRNISSKLNLSDTEQIRLEINIDQFKDAFTTNNNILKTTVIDENKAFNSNERKNISDILEAFVRINTEGTRLNRSDLIFSMIKLNWKESAINLPNFIEEINNGNSFELDNDFVIRCLFAISGLGTKFDVNLLRIKTNVEKIKMNYESCCDSIRSTLDFVRDHCWIQSSNLIGSYHNLIPFVYYLHHTNKHMVPSNQINNLRKSLYLFGFTSPFSRYADSRLGRFIKRKLEPKVTQGNFNFPIEDAVYWVWYWERVEDFSTDIIQRNPELMLHVVQQQTGRKVLYKNNSPQIDHIFPRSTLLSMKFKENEVNHFANYWILSKGMNQNKSNKDPKIYFKDIDKIELKRALINTDLLDYKSYKIFLKDREQKLLKVLKEKLNLEDSDYNVRNYYKVD